jgi:hypothetical protein
MDERPLQLAGSDDLVEMSDAAMRVTFARTGDRWTHWLARGRDGRIEHELARVVESRPDHDDPGQVVSPVYQELHQHELAGEGGLCLLLTGRAFEHHFSASFDLRADRADPEWLVLDVDIADRCRARVASLCATYRVARDSAELEGAGPGRISWSGIGPGPSRIELLAVGSSQLALSDPEPLTMRVQAVAAIEPGSHTQRLRYRWRWTRLAGRTR